jgi:hypothetical protein
VTGLPPGPRTPGFAQALSWVWRPGPWLEHCRERYGDCFTIRVAGFGERGFNSIVLLADPGLIKEVFAGGSRFANVNASRRALAPMFGDQSVIVIDGHQHLRRRRMILPPLHGERLAGYSLILSRHPFGTNPLGGSHNALVDINANDEAVGLRYGPTGTNPLFVSNRGQAQTLPVTGQANGIALGPLVSVTTTGADGQQHVLIWNPTTGSVRDLGPGIARGIDVHGVVVGQSGGEAAYWSADGAVHLLGFPGFLRRVNLFGQVVGVSTQSGGLTPITLNLRQPNVVTPLKLPRGWSFGSPKGLSDSGLTVGTAYKNPNGGLPSEGILWRSPNKPVTVQQLVRGHAPKRVQFSDAAGVDDNGLIVGAVTPRLHGRASASGAGALENAYEVTPPIGPPPRLRPYRPGQPFYVKLNNLNKLLYDLSKYTNGQADEKLKPLNQLSINAGETWLKWEYKNGTLEDVCAKFNDLSVTFLNFGFTNASFDLNALFQFRGDGLGSVAEIKRELGCP